MSPVRVGLLLSHSTHPPGGSNPVVRLTNLCSLSSLMRALQSFGFRYPNQLIRTDTIFVTTLSMESDIMNVAEQLRNNENW